MQFFRLIFVVALCVGVVGCKRAAPVGSVWVVDGPQGGRLFLCGTIHLLREKDYPLAPAYEVAYAHSDKLVLELPPGASGPELSRQMTQLGTYPAGMTLAAQVSPETWAAVQQWGEKRGLQAAQLNRFRPWFVALLMTSTEYALLGAKPELGVDVHFEARAQRDGKAAEGLESAALQLGLFAALSERQQRDLLEQTLGEIGTAAAEYEKLIQAWKDGDLEALREMLYREALQYPDLMNLFLIDRNLAWMGRLEQMLNQGEKVMVLVGTGHFTAESGLLELLRQRGFRVRHFREVSDL